MVLLINAAMSYDVEALNPIPPELTRVSPGATVPTQPAPIQRSYCTAVIYIPVHIIQELP